MEHGNLVDGQRVPSTGGGLFLLRAAIEPFQSLGSWPVSTRADVDGALAALTREAPSWAALPIEERTDRLERAASHLREDEYLAEAVARRLGLDPGELAAHRRVSWSARSVPRSAAAAPHEARLGLCLTGWSGLYQRAFEAAAAELAAGHALLLFSDARLPHLADGLARALLEAGVHPGALALLHAPTDEAMAVAIQAPALRSLRVFAPVERVSWIRHRIAGRAQLEERLSIPSASACEIDEEQDLEEAATEIVERAFGRGRTVFGQIAGQVGRAYCPEHLHSRLTEVLLATLEQSELVRDPLPLIDTVALERVHKAWELGLDEGATLISGGEDFAAEGSGNRRVLPTVFTNVEPGMRFARRPEPMPVLALIRATDRRATVRRPSARG